MDVTLAVKKDRRLSIGSHDQSNTPLARTPNALVDESVAHQFYDSIIGNKYLPPRWLKDLQKQKRSLLRVAKRESEMLFLT